MSIQQKRKALGIWLKSQREKHNLTQAEMAKALHYENAQIISNIERGVSSMPAGRIADFAQVLRVSPLELQFRILVSTAKSPEIAFAVNVTLQYIPLIEALQNAPETIRTQIIEMIHRKLEPTKKGAQQEDLQRTGSLRI
jgi:transcriptional regulator with XRE-family HTH domain